MATKKPARKQSTAVAKAQPAPAVEETPKGGAAIEDAGFGELADTDEVDTSGNTEYGRPQQHAAIMAKLKEKGHAVETVGGTHPPLFPSNMEAGGTRIIVPRAIDHISKEDGGGSEFDALVCDVVNTVTWQPEYTAQVNLSKGLTEFFMNEDGALAETFTNAKGKAEPINWGHQAFAVTYAGQLAAKGTKAGLKLWRVDICRGLTFA